MDSNAVTQQQKEKASHKAATRQRSSPNLSAAEDPLNSERESGRLVRDTPKKERRASSKASWAVLRESPRFVRRNEQRRFHSELDLREVAVIQEKRSSLMSPMQRSVSVPQWMDSLSAPKHDGVIKSHTLVGVPKSRQWRQMLFTLGSRLRTSLMSSDSTCSSTTHSISDRRGDSLRPTSMDSALFYGVNSEDSEIEAGPDEEEEIGSNNSSGSFYERNFELSCRDEIFRDSAVFSEDAISQLSTDIPSTYRIPVVRKGDIVPGLELGFIERTESGFAEEEDDVEQKIAETRK